MYWFFGEILFWMVSLKKRIHLTSLFNQVTFLSWPKCVHFTLQRAYFSCRSGRLVMTWFHTWNWLQDSWKHLLKMNQSQIIKGWCHDWPLIMFHLRIHDTKLFRKSRGFMFQTQAFTGCFHCLHDPLCRILRGTWKSCQTWSVRLEKKGNSFILAEYCRGVSKCNILIHLVLLAVFL